MALSLIQYCLEYCEKSLQNIRGVGGNQRGIYVLYQGLPKRKPREYNVLYVGMTDVSIRRRLKSHARSKRKSGWTHFSAYAVWPNITKDEIAELEGLFRHIYRYDSRANIYNLHKRFKALKGITTKKIKEWQTRVI